MINRIGLIFNIIGSLCIAFSFGKNIADAHQLDEGGRKIFLASLRHPCLFGIGIIFIILGFLLMFASTFLY